MEQAADSQRRGIRKYAVEYVTWWKFGRYPLKIEGMENLRAAEEISKGMVVIPNHLSFSDAPIIAQNIKFGKPPVFLMDANVYQKQYDIDRNFRAILSEVDILPINFKKPGSIRTAAKLAAAGRPVVIFPEGALSRTGGLMKIHEGAAAIAYHADVPFLPMTLDGMQRIPGASPHLGSVYATEKWPQLRIVIHPAASLNVPETTVDAPGEERNVSRREMKEMRLARVRALMQGAAVEGRDKGLTNFGAFQKARRDFGGKRIIVQQPNRDYPTEMDNASYDDLALGTYVLGDLIDKALGEVGDERKNVGLMLPNSTTFICSFFGLQEYDRVPALMNVINGIPPFLASVAAADLKTIVTARQFLIGAFRARGQKPEDVNIEYLEIVKALRKKEINLIFLEDITKHVEFLRSLKLAWAKAHTIDQMCRFVGSLIVNFPSFIIGRATLWLAKQRAFKERFLPQAGRNVRPHDVAAILFTSGSEGTPKGVGLTHANILSNAAQVMASQQGIAPGNDKVFNAAPMFHSFGLGVGTMMPLVYGVVSVQFPNPRDFTSIASLVHYENCTIMFGPSSLLHRWGDVAAPEDFGTLRMVIAGAEPLKRETRELYYEKFGLRLIEGYGVTETAPVIAANSNAYNADGSLGLLMPGMNARLEFVEGAAEATGRAVGRLVVQGPNVMAGYYKVENPGVLQPTTDGWHDTGDVVSVSLGDVAGRAEGGVTLKDNARLFFESRAKRSKKINGEFVNFDALERYLSEGFKGGHTHVALDIQGTNGRDQIVVFTTDRHLSREKIVAYFKAIGTHEREYPAKVYLIDKMPQLGSGKTDYQKLTAVATAVENADGAGVVDSGVATATSTASASSAVISD
jgi:acyl-[acyl-carrier-protein]-phospholipid O-acyltransferase / long-chain-fatty-acid--[acyl-carrier-protein] ligase